MTVQAHSQRTAGLGLLLLLLLQGGGGKASVIKSWRGFGPFPVGKTEYDADPLLAQLPIHEATKNSSLRLISETSSDGFVGWQPFRAANDQGWVQVQFPNVNYNHVVQALNSITAIEFQAWFYASFKVPSARTYYVRCQGVHNFEIAPAHEPATRFHHGDIYSNLDLWTPLSLNTGTYHLRFRLRGRGSAQFRCELRSTSLCNHLVASHSCKVSHPYSSLQRRQVVLLRVTSARHMHQSIAHTSAALSLPCYVAPGQLRRCGLQVYLPKFTPSKLGDACVLLTIEAVDENGASLGISFETALRCRGRLQSFRYSYLDHDSTLVYAAAIAPQDCSTCAGTGGCDFELSLSGVGVTPEGQADAHKYKAQPTQADYSFGYSDRWVICPERPHAHNWEGMGFQTATYAPVMAAASADPAHHPLSFESASAPGTELSTSSGYACNHHWPFSSTKSVLETAIAEHDCTKSAMNMAGKPILIRHGSHDRTVPHLRLNVTYQEFEGQDHWWWDSSLPNDGGVVFDPTVRTFVQTAAEWRHRVRPAQFDVASLNPATFSGLYGVRILNPRRTGRAAHIRVSEGPAKCSFTLEARNVFAFEISAKVGL
ncbi:uncharacterized protein MONBRDRAFT_25727 [Monosiga brevicollis MX1]|uniref:Uncharacterized protein n=1 Tax=Monosiga brevicollis TaxID=81824 RepID=A9V091_MONBE|nr:uncharacterized protein MONBRDRAFT_25727 [Monosiga brevicollis MX1]EDQ88969.1 predicted protein [Monosiga brevicollis MX1]|eukprot:XP_001746074.1 hypothetical protein [Monosiga brevicollis MX1]